MMHDAYAQVVKAAAVGSSEKTTGRGKYRSSVAWETDRYRLLLSFSGRVTV
jgi:hypothetical protein